MSNDQLELSNGTLRQRRNLVTVSILLLLIHFGELEFGGQVVFLGAAINLNNPDIIVPFLFISLVYLLWRFYQYSHIDSAYTHLIGQRQETLTASLDRATKKEIFANLPGVTDIQGNYSYRDLKKISKSMYQITVTPITGEGRKDSPVTVKLKSSKIDRQRLLSLARFLFRGKIITDLLFPYLIAVFSVVVYFA